MPQPRDQKDRPAVIPDSVFKARTSTMEVDNAPVEPVEEVPFWLRGFQNTDWKKKYILKNDDWKFDPIPEIIDGKNIADFVDPDVLQKLEELEQEEEERMKELDNQMESEDDEDLELDDDEKELVERIRHKKKIIIQHHRSNKHRNSAVIPKKKQAEPGVNDLESHLIEMGIDPTKAVERARSRSQSRGRKRTRSQSATGEEEEHKVRRTSRSRTPSRGEGYADLKQKEHADKLARINQRERNKSAKKGEGDRVILNPKPKHLFSGKKSGGKLDRR